MTDITVIIPSRNRLWSLPRAVSSCRSAQLEIEVIVIDDGSTDGTSEWLSKQSDIVVVRGEGWGKPWGVNKALTLSTGRYLRFLDSDDWLNARANELQFDIAKRELADVVVAGMDIYQDDELVESVPWTYTEDFIAQQLGESPGSHYSAFLFRRDFVRDIPHRTLFPASAFASRDDRCYVLEVALRTPRLAICAHSTLCHRHHHRGRLQFRPGLRGFGSNMQLLNVYQQVLRLLERSGELNLRRRRAATHVLWPLAHRIAYFQLEEGCQVADWVYQLDPEFKPPEAGLLGKLYRHLGFRTTEKLLALRRKVVWSQTGQGLSSPSILED